MAIIHTGVLMKKGVVRKAYKQRWFVLQDDKLWYYKSQDSKSPLGYIDLNDSILKPGQSHVDDGEVIYTFEIVCVDRAYQLAARTEPEYLEWLSVLSKHLKPLAISVETAEQEKEIIKEAYAYALELENILNCGTALW